MDVDGILFVKIVQQVRGAWISWAECSSMAVRCPTTSVWRSSNWRRPASVRASSRASCACPTAASPRSSTVTRRRAASEPESSVGPDRSTASSQTSSAVSRPTVWRTTASFPGKSETGIGLTSNKATNCRLIDIYLKRKGRGKVSTDYWCYFFFFMTFRLIKEGLAERSTAPSVSAISRYLRDTSDDTKSEPTGKHSWKLISIRNYGI